MTMSPKALKTYRLLRALNLPTATIKKIAITSEGKPDFSQLTDEQFDVVLRAIRRVCPQKTIDTPAPPTGPREIRYDPA